jgi:nitronate monooxygenase
VLRTMLTDRFSLQVPIVSAPMAGAAGAALASAVSLAGGMGMIGVGSSTDPEWIAATAAEVRAATERFGIGLMAWNLARRPDHLDAVVAARPTLVSVSFGDHGPALDPLRGAGIAVATQVGDVASARRALDDGIDVIVARGGEGGGHGDDRVATLPLLQGVLDKVGDRAVVLAAGGIATGRGLAAVLAAGAAGAWIGTALLACTEALTPPAARRLLLEATELGTVSTQVFDIAQNIPWPPEYRGRALANVFTSRWHGRESELADSEEARQAVTDARASGDYDTAFVYAGQAVGSLSSERPAGQVIEEINQDAEALLRRW